MKRILALVFVLALGVPPVVFAQRRVAGFIDPIPTAKLKQLFPAAVTFTPRGEKDTRNPAEAGSHVPRPLIFLIL